MTSRTPGESVPDEMTLRKIDVVGIIGWGRMGSLMGGHLVTKGWSVVAADPAPKAADAITAQGAGLMHNARAVAAASDLVLVMVVDDAQVRDVFLGDQGLLAGARPGTIVAICASVKPRTCQQLSDMAASSGVVVIDAALARGERGAEKGNLLLLCGGPTAAIEACRDAFATFSTDVVVIGDVGAGQVAKSVNNILLWANVRVDFEMLRLAQAFGVDLLRIREAVALGTGANKPLAEWGLHRLQWPKKDVDVAIELAQERGVAVPFVRSLAELIDELVDLYPDRF